MDVERILEDCFELTSNYFKTAKPMKCLGGLVGASWSDPFAKTFTLDGNGPFEWPENTRLRVVCDEHRIIDYFEFGGEGIYDK